MSSLPFPLTSPRPRAIQATVCRLSRRLRHRPAPPRIARPGRRFLEARLSITAWVLLWVGSGLALTHAARTADPVV